MHDLSYFREHLDLFEQMARNRGLTLDLEGFRPVTNLIVKFSIRSAEGAKIQHEVFLTINRLPD